MKLTKSIGALLAAGALIFGTAGLISCSDGNGGSSSSDPTVNKNGDGTTTITIDDDQKGFISSSGSLGTGKTGWNATNDSFWENFGSAGDANIKYCVNTDTAGEYTMVLRYCFGGWCDTLKDITISINGKPVVSANPGNIFYLDYTANKHWADKEIPITLDAGDNFIVIKCAAGTTRDFVVPDISGISFSAAVPNEKKVTGATITGTVNSMPNIDWISITSKAQNVKMSAGSANATAYWNLTASSMNETYGTITVSPVQESYTNGTEVTVTATPADGYSFDSWNGSTKSGWISSNEATFKLVITSDVTLNARFIPSTFDKTTLAGLEGYAAICDDKGTAYTVTGGFGGETITLTTLADLDENKAKISGNDPYIIKVAARITTVDNKSLAFDVGSNKTLIGEAGQDYGFKNINPKISGENVIVKNLHFGDVIGDDYWGGAGNDALSIKGGKHIWIDHCEFSSSIDPKNNDGTALPFSEYKGQVDLEGEKTDPETKWKKDFYDGLLDVSELSRFVSVSNCYFHDHWKACLCGGSNDKEEQRANGSLVRLTMYNNYFNNIHARQPLFRFGKAHIYSSYLYGADDASGIEARAKSEVYVDNVCFENIKSGKEVGYWNSSSGDIGSGSWKVVDCIGASGNSGSVSTPPYTWTKTSASDSKANLPSSVGIEK